MGRLRKKHNWKARQQSEVVVDHTEEQKVQLQVDLEDVRSEGYDESNPLTLPSKKRTTKKVQQKDTTIRKLSKKQRKHLEKIVQLKEKKAKRADLLASLSEVQASQEEMSLLTSLAEAQTKRPKSRLAAILD
ncbi:probable ATP-dependent RNA helicase kurz [Lingula anatina]|uniref:Probable ATP-dependent RNA helicase kurz n=1 Tax=Lingula anatina TaxID=7574 RepID=A0A1S3I050_LINAN|nr:probable ATP-dependent RNA helicase kurz [Lingula anatina]|eukprot:XP_013390724.1 probable ATP-dependent RNA helicase kurz [Lingula anatina]